MKKALLLLITLILSNSEFKGQAWSQLTDFPGLERDDGVAFVINNKAYCGSGLQVGWSLGRDFYCLDLGTETWTAIASMSLGNERQYACGFTDGTNGFVFGGEAGGNDLNDLWMYSPTTNSWTAKTSKPGNGVRGAACFVIGNLAYIIGGAYTSTGALNEVWAYDMSLNTWAQKNNLPFVCWRSCATAVSGKGYLLFGREANGRFRKELFEYNPALDSWTFLNSFPGAGRAYSTMQNINNNLTVFGGLDTLNTYYNTVWSYDIGFAQWTQLVSLTSFGRKGGMGFANNNILYYTCGIDVLNTRLKETWKANQFVGIKEFDKKENIAIYPNPASDIITIQLSNSKNLPYKIIGMKGETVLEGILNDKNQIQVSTLSQGIYQLVLGNSSAKILIE